jgi:2',3'-cyclic-nucleotide 2'-phosphodiesterase (5'-nucleotidase family)
VNAGTGITVNNVVVNSAGTQITATFVITPSATLGGHNVTVSTAGGTSNARTFTVLGAVVSISAPAPLMNGGGLSTKVATITVSNANTATAPLTLTAAPTFARVNGTGTGTFSITGGTCVNGAAVNPGSSCTINVQYAPTNTSNATYHVTISGTGDSQVPRDSANFTVN